MIRSEGALSPYKGLSASLFREGSYSGIRMGSYDFSKAQIVHLFPWANKDGFGTKLAAGMFSGVLGAAIANPADLIKVRMQSVGAHGTLRDHVGGVLREKGLRGLYRGIGPTTIRAGILTSSQLGVYDHAKHVWVLLHCEISSAETDHRDIVDSRLTSRMSSKKVSRPISLRVE